MPRSGMLPSAAALATMLLFGACGDSEADDQDMRVDENSAMDTTPAGTPAPPSVRTLAGDLHRQTAVTMTEWSVALGSDALPTGEVTFQAANTGAEAHSLAIDGPGVSERTDPIEPGGSVNLTVRLEPGTYRLYCPESEAGASHASRGMSAPFVVR